MDFFLNQKKGEERNLKMRFITKIIETLFLNGDGSVTEYCRGRGEIELCLRKSEKENNAWFF